MADKREIVSWVKGQLQNYSDPFYAEKEKRYTKSTLCFYGVSKPKINTLARKIKRQWKFETSNHLLPIVQSLWDSAFHEERTVAIVLAALHQNLFGVEHLKAIFQQWMEQATSWGHVDELCVRVVGMIVMRYPGAFDILDGWADAESLWLKRASLVSHLPSVRKNQPSFMHISNACKKLADDNNFFVRKSIGWVLRELSEKHPDEAGQILLSIGCRASNLAIREAIRKMPKQRQEQIETAISCRRMEV